LISKRVEQCRGASPVLEATEHYPNWLHFRLIPRGDLWLDQKQKLQSVLSVQKDGYHS
jgi:hypothetical protein